MNHRLEFAAFLKRVAAHDFGAIEWQKLVVCHYDDELLENISSILVKMSIDREGGKEWTDSEMAALQHWYRQLTSESLEDTCFAGEASVQPQEGSRSASPKQAVYCWLIHHGFVELRIRESHAAGASWTWFMQHQQQCCRYGVALASLLHRLHETLLDPEFNDTDLGFLNHAVPRFLQQVGDEADTRLVGMLVRLHDAVPEKLHAKLTWHPSESHRRVLEE